MGLFNRYDVSSQGLERSFWEGSDKFCNPKDYSVSEEECRLYLEDLKTGNKLNDEWNRERRLRYKQIAIVICLAFPFGITPIVSVWLFNPNESFLGFLASAALCWIAIGVSIWVYEKIDEYLENKVYLDKFYPKVNVRIEKLFDDYLWKCRLLSEAEAKGRQEWQLVHEKVVRMSHPDLDVFLETVEEELKNPIEDCIFGDVKFGMSPDEIYRTKVFKGLELDSSKHIELGFRETYLGHFFAIRSSYTSFQLENEHLVKFVITDFCTYRKMEIVEHFILCCEKLNQYYGNPSNLHKKNMGDSFELRFPYDKAIFHIGMKSILLYIEESSFDSYRLKLSLQK